MTQKNTFSIRFYINNVKARKDGACPVYARITVNGQRTLLALQRWIEPSRWGNDGYAKGKQEDAQMLNAYIDTVRNKLYDCQRELIASGKPITADNIKNAFTGNGQKSRTVLEVFEHHNNRMSELIPHEYSPSTLKSFKTTIKHVEDFMEHTYHCNDMQLEELSLEWINDFDFYIRSVRKCSNNPTVKYIRCLKKVINMAIDNTWLDSDPFKRYKGKMKYTQREFLNAEELKTLEEKNFSIKRLEEIRDVFVFCCYTGYAYVDVEQLTTDNIVMHIDGEKWLYKNRQKTDTKCNVPLLPKAMAIIEKYKEHPECKVSGKLLPVKSNQKYNAYLKEVADLCGIKKLLTTHVARHTFATTVTLSNGVSIEAISEMLGHSNVKTTQIYAKVVASKITAEMHVLRNKLEEKENKTPAVLSKVSS